MNNAIDTRKIALAALFTAASLILSARPTRCDSGADGIVRMEETEGLSMNNAIDTRKIALAALFTAASLILSLVQIPIFPIAPWLMYDPSGIVCLIAALAFGPKLGAAVAIISWLPRVFLDPFNRRLVRHEPRGDAAVHRHRRRGCRRHDRPRAAPLQHAEDGHQRHGRCTPPSPSRMSPP